MGQGCVFILLLLVAASTSVPLTRRKRIKREDENSSSNTTIPLNGCILDNEIYERGQDVPSLGPCEKCVCEAPDVVCSMIKCQPNSGCRIIQQSGQCCPEYKCDCEYNGHIYNNGERLDKPEDPCQVCYCKGGEIMCTSITCYERDDCKPLYTAGQCCPKYDHCPVETNRASSNSVRSVNTSLYSPKREMQPWPLTKPSNILTSVSYDESSPSPNIYPQTIRIVEILPTTPGYANKPSEVSVIPRIKTNDNSGSRESEETSKAEISSTSENFNEYSSSTSEVEHLRETTPEIKEVKSEQTTLEISDHVSSTLNPLAESVDLNAHPDSYRFSTVFPNYYYTEGSLNSVEVETTNLWNESEGSGYELLTGGIFEEISTLATLVSNKETTIENTEPVVNLTGTLVNGENQEINEELRNRVSDVPTFEAYTATEAPIINNEFHNNSNDEEHGNSSDSSNEKQFENINATSSMENENNQSMKTVFRNSHLEKEDSSSESSSEEREQSDESSSTTLEPITITSSFGVVDKNFTGTKETTANIKTTENDEISTTPKEVEYSVVNTEQSEIYSISEVPDEQTTYGLQTEWKRSSIGNYRNLDSDILNEEVYDSKEQSSKKSYSSAMEDSSTSPSLISFPPVLNVHTLDYSEMSPQIENKTNQNTSSMAKVGIYHPTKPNELASYLTVVDDKNNASTVNEGTAASHILLTPNDLKKLAEILIHEKIKPAYPETSTEKNETDATEPYYTTESTIHSYYKSSTVSPRSVPENANEELITDPGNYTSVESGSGKEIENKSVENDTALLYVSDYSVQNTSSTQQSTDEKNKESTPTDLPDTDNTTLSNNEESKSSKEVTASQDEIVRNFVSGNQKLIKELANDDPNTSRQIRIPENANQYSALLDDRDLLILENFFKKNMGIH